MVKVYKAIRKELDLYNQKLAEKPEVVVLNKIDSLPEDEVAKKVAALEKACGKKVIAISAVAKKNLFEALRAVSAFVTRDRRKKEAEQEDSDSSTVKKEWSPLD